MSKCPYHDAFKELRKQGPVVPTEFDGAPVAMFVGYKELRKATRDTESFSSDAPFRVPIPREEDVRTVRQYPLEVDPPEHKIYRKIVEPFFRRPMEPEYIEKMEKLLDELIRDALERDQIEIVRDFAIPLQSRSLTYLTNMPESEADIWIQWGTHVFRDESGVSKGHEMEAYTNSLFDRAEANPGGGGFVLRADTSDLRRPQAHSRRDAGLCEHCFCGWPGYDHQCHFNDHRLLCSEQGQAR